MFQLRMVKLLFSLNQDRKIEKNKVLKRHIDFTGSNKVPTLDKSLPSNIWHIIPFIFHAANHLY